MLRRIISSLLFFSLIAITSKAEMTQCVINGTNGSTVTVESCSIDGNVIKGTLLNDDNNYSATVEVSVKVYYGSVEKIYSTVVISKPLVSTEFAIQAPLLNGYSARSPEVTSVKGNRCR